MTLADYKVTFNEATIESQVNAARDERDRLALWSRVLPITFTATGLIALIGGALLGAFSLRTEAALIEPGLDTADAASSAAAPETACPAPRPRPRSCPAADRTTSRPAGPPTRDGPDVGSTTRPRRAARRTALALVPAGSLALALLVAAPLLAPGYLLLRDAVSTPRSYLSDDALGLMSAPRATPQDFAVALASHLVDGGVVVKALLVLGLWLAGWGAARLAATVLPGAGPPGQFVAITLAIWNPYVAERLLQGHWSLLVGYGCLPWVATTMLALRSDDRAPIAGVLCAGILDCDWPGSRRLD